MEYLPFPDHANKNFFCSYPILTKSRPADIFIRMRAYAVYMLVGEFDTNALATPAMRLI
jgi:hypothetical protein